MKDLRKKGQQAKSPSEFAWSFGAKPIIDLAINKPERIIRVFIIDTAIDLFNKIRSLIEHDRIQRISRKEFLELFPNIDQVNHQSICAKIYPATGIALKQLISKSKKQGRGIIIGLDQVQDPANLGSIFRSAEALGADGIFYTRNNSATISPLVRRVSVGATEFLPFTEVTNLANALIELKKEGFWIFGTTLNENSLDIEDTEVLFPVVLLFGSEGTDYEAERNLYVIGWFIYNNMEWLSL